MKFFKSRKSKIVIAVLMASFLIVFANLQCSQDTNAQESVATDRWLPELPQAAEFIDVVLRSGTDTPVGDLAARSLQGLVNKTMPRIYIAEEWYRGNIDVEQLRKVILEVYGDRTLNQLELETGHQSDRTFWTLFKKYGSTVKKLYIYDKALPDSINVAVMLAGRNSGIAVDSVLAGQLAGYGLESENVIQKYGFKDHIQINQWIMNNMISKSNKKTVFVLNPSGRDEHSDFLPQAYDLAVATDALIFHLNPSSQSEVALQKEILDQYSTDTLVIGWAGADVEGDYVKSISAAGKSVVCTDWGYSNGSVWGSFQKFVSSANQPVTPARYEVDNSTTYVAFCVSDGDAWHYSSRDLLSFWNQEVRGSVPIGWTIPALFSEASPLMMSYLYNTKSDTDEFIQGPSGYGYVYAGKMPAEAYDGYLQKSRIILEAMGLNMVNYWDLCTGNNSMTGDNEECIRKYATEIKPAAIFRGHDGDCSYYVRDGTVVIQEMGDNKGAGTRSTQDIVEAVRRVEERTADGKPSFVIINVEAWGDGVASIQPAVTELMESGGNYEFVKPSELIAAIKTYTARKDINLFEMTTDGSSTEMQYLYENSGSGIFNSGTEQWRFADNSSSWTYGFGFSDALSSGKLVLNLGGQYRVSVSADGKSWEELASSTWNVPKSQMELELPATLSGTSQLYVKFSDTNTGNGYGSSLQSLALKYKLTNGTAESAPKSMGHPAIENVFSVTTDRTDVEEQYLYENSGSEIFDSGTKQWRFADNSSYWIYGFGFSDALSSGKLVLNLGGQYRVSVSADGSRWEELTGSAQYVSMRLMELELPATLSGASRLYVKFSDANTVDGLGPSLQSLALKYKLVNRAAESAPESLGHPVVENIFSMMTDGTTVEMQYLNENNESGIFDSGTKQWRFADNNSSWIYGFSFSDALSSGKLVLNLGGQYRVSVSIDGNSWEELTGSTQLVSMSLMEFELPVTLSGASRLYVMFSDANIVDGFGPILQSLVLKYKLANGAAEIAPGSLGHKNTFTLTADGSTKEMQYLYENSGSEIFSSGAEKWRFADNSSSWIYGFGFSDALSSGKLVLNLGGQYRVSVSADGNSWEELASSTEFVSRREMEFELPAAVTGYSRLYVRFSDAKTGDGFGPCLQGMKLKYILASGAAQVVPEELQ